MSVDPTPAPDGQDSKDAIKERLMRDPQVRERIQHGLEKLRSGDIEGPAMTREQVQDLLRDET